MKIVSLHAAMPAFEQGLNNVSQILKSTFSELGIEIEEINLSVCDIHFFDGIKSQTVENLLGKINNADGVIIETTAVLAAPCGMTQTFMEHLGFNVYKNVFYQKKCFCVAVSHDGSEKKACDYITDIITEFGGIDVGRIAISESAAKKALGDETIKEAIEKYAEDWYRILKQERKFFVPQTRKKDLLNNAVLENNTDISSKSTYKPKKIKASEILEQIDYNSFNARQEEDIKEISKFLTSQYNSVKTEVSENNTGFSETVYNNINSFDSKNVVPHIKSCRQRTQSLYHYFQPQLASGIDAVIQINVKGDEKFECYFVIHESDCEYFDGIHENPDVTVFSDCSIWLDILNGKYTIQKAFMIGQLKVRGNFVLMTKFDQLFKMQK